ncbi:MAG: PQQ-binding-like beta-propeller repeat protein [Thermoguttaceae bacterium]
MRVRPPVAGAAVDEDTGPGSFAAPDRNILQALNRAQKVLKEHRYGEALEGLSQILRSNEDFFFQPDRKVPIYKSLKAEAQQLLGQMPREGRELYEVRNGADARDKLNRAVAAGDATGLSEISAQLFHTQAGYEATYLLALYHMDHGAPLAGALTLKRLRDAGAAAETFEPGLSLTQAACYYQAGMTGDCKQVLVDLKRRLARPVLQLAGHEVPWFEQDSDAPAWLAKATGLQRLATAVETDRWAMFRGDAARNASAVGSAPLLNLRWQVPVAENPILQKALVEQEAYYRDHNIAVFSGLHPLAVGDVILMRTATNVLAVDFQTGKAIWETTPEQDPAADARFNRFNGMFVGGRNNMSQPVQYGQRIWDDATYGTLSSDGKLVFVIEELPLGVVGPNLGFMMGGGRNDLTNRGISNRLAAYDIHTEGKLQWALGGQDSVGHGDTFFLGPPLPLRGQLYVMAEIKDEMRLLALDGATGNLLWSQQLAMVESNITQDPVRRLAGVSPSYSDGVLICPTGAGCVVAIDLATRSLLWGYIYTRPNEQAVGRHMRGVNPFQNAFYNSQGPVSRWLDGTATIVNGRVLITPAEADALYCLNLADGKLMWDPKPRVENRENGDHVEHCYIACVHKGVVVLVGRNSIDAVNLDDGSKAWGGRTITIPTGAGVCGHGFYAGGRYFVPLSSGEVMAIDLESGKVNATVKSRRSSVPGNLVCYRGRVISQGLDGLELYYQVDAARDEVARRLAANPDDVEGLTLRGEMFLDAGKATKAVADFRRAYSLDKKSDSQGRTRELLRDALLAGLHDDFVAHRSMAGEVEPLLDEPAQRATYFRCMATGLHHAGEWRQAVEYYLKLVDLEEAKPALEKVDRSYLVRRDCWVQAQLGALRNEGGAAAAAEIDRAMEHRLEEARMDSSGDGLKRFLAFFGTQPQAAPVREELLKHLTQTGRIMEAELLMAAAVDSTDRKAQAGLLAEMAALNFGARRLSEAAACFRQLHRQFADVPCHAGMTSDHWLAGFPDGDALRREVDLPAPVWPTGEVEHSPPDVNENPFPRGPRYDILFGGPSGPFYTDDTVSLESNQQEVSLRDGTGHLVKPISLVQNGRVFGVMYNPNSTLARSCGHLLLISTGTKIFALDPWQASGKTSQILWSQDLTDSANDNFGNMVFINNGVGDFRANPFGPVNARYVSFLRRRNVVAVDPFTGESLWVRQDIPAGSEVFGDEQYLFVLPPGSDEASVYRAADGELLGTRRVPRPKSAANANYVNYGVYPFAGNSALSNSGIDFWGRYVLTWQGSDSVLGLLDPWLQKAVWTSRKFATGSRVSVVGSEAVGVLEPGGHFVMIALADGRTIADLQLEARPLLNVTDLVVTRMGDQYIVLAHDNHMAGNLNVNDQLMQPLQGMFCYPVRRARVYALDLKGKLTWPAPIDVDHQQFLLSQPGRLPVLLFAGFRNENLNGQITARTPLVAVDRRNGRIVYDSDIHGPMRWMGVDIRGDAAEKTVRVVAYNGTVKLTFTDKPIQTTVRQSSGVKKPSGKLGEALLDAVKGAAGAPQ